MIFYFSGTGNSKHIAEKIAAGTGDNIFNIADYVQDEGSAFELKSGEPLGFVVPVYFMGIPIIVADFLKKLKVSAEQDYYSYLILNCGDSTANAEGIFNSVYKVKAVFGIASVENYVPMYKIENESEINKHLDKTEKEIDVIVEHIKSCDTGSFNALKKRLPRLISLIVYPIYKKGRKTSKFTVNNDCIGCGLCEKICPRKAIELKEESRSGLSRNVKYPLAVCIDVRLPPSITVKKRQITAAM